MLSELKNAVLRANLDLAKHGLVAWTAGNVSARADDQNLVVIKPSGMPYDEMECDDMVIVDMEGTIVEGERGPSSDTASHLAIYRRMPAVGSVIHTHSRYATAFAAVGRPIPCVLTAIADEFGGPIPCAPYAPIGGDDIGEAVVEHIGESPALLLAQHGVITIGKTIAKALQAAVMVEDVAATVATAESLGTPEPLAQEEILANYRRYQDRYGTDAASMGVRR